VWIKIRKAYGDHEDWSDPYRDEGKRVAGLRPTRQTKLYNFDPMMAHPKWGTDLAAMRIHDEENVLGGGLHPTEQGESNIDFERGQTDINGVKFPPRYSDDDMVDIEDRGVEYRMRPDGVIQFKIKRGDKGIWMTMPTQQDAERVWTHRPKDYVTLVRGKSGSLRGQGKAHERNSDESKEEAAEMFLQRKKPIDPDRLVHVKIPKGKTARDVLRRYGIGARGTGNRKTYVDKHGEEQEISSWNDAKATPKPVKKSDALREMIQNFKPNYQQSRGQSISTENPLVDLDEGPTRGDDIQDKLMENLVGIREPRSRRKLRSMGAPIRDANQLRGEAGERKRVERRAKKEKGRNKGAIMQDAIMGRDVPKLVARYPTHFEEERNKQGMYDIDNMLHTLDSLSERGEYDAVEGLLDSVPREIRFDRAIRYREALDKTPWLHNRNIMMEGGNDENTDVADEFGVPHDFPFTGSMNQMDESVMQRLEDVEGLTGTESLRIPTPRHHEALPYFRRDRSGKFILPPEGLSTSGDDKETPRHLAAWQHTDMPRPIWMKTMGGDEKPEPSSKFVEVHPGQEGTGWPHWSDFNQSQDFDSMQEDNLWRDQSLGFDETGKGNLFRPKQDPNNPAYRAREERGEPLTPLPRKLTLATPVSHPDDEKFEAEFGSDGRGVFTGLPFNVGTGFTTGEPMDIALQLLKYEGNSSVRGMSGADNIYHYPTELNYNAMSNYLVDNPDTTLGSMISPYLQGQFTDNTSTPPPSHQSQRQSQLQSTVPAPFPQTEEQVEGAQKLIDSGFSSNIGTKVRTHYDNLNNAVRVLSRGLRSNPGFKFSPPRVKRPNKTQRRAGVGRSRSMQNAKLSNLLSTPVSANMAEMDTAPEAGVPIATGEPMEIAFQLLKERKSPEAFAHKLEYDKKYQKTPKRVKYREQLNAERRKRGIYGKGGKDVSHTQGGKLTLESAHNNRARHFKNRGTLRRVKVR
jgi:hypothetical protein